MFTPLTIGFSTKQSAGGGGTSCSVPPFITPADYTGVVPYCDSGRAISAGCAYDIFEITGDYYFGSMKVTITNNTCPMTLYYYDHTGTLVDTISVSSGEDKFFGTWTGGGKFVVQPTSSTDSGSFDIDIDFIYI